MNSAVKIILALSTLTPLYSSAQIFAQSGYEEGKDGILLLTTPCEGEAGKAGFKMATMRSNGSVIGGCYVENNRQNFIVKWQNGIIDELSRSIFTFGAKKAARKSESPANPGKFETYSCEYQDLSKNIILGGRCHKQETSFSGNFGYTLTWPSGSKLSIEYVKSQSGNHIWKINGKNAVAIEINREHLRGFTTDLNQFIEWQDQP